jgi:hypothetical protein
MTPTMHTIHLEPYEYEWALHVAARRFTANWDTPNAPHYKPHHMEDDRTAQAAACVSELAVAKLTNRYCAGHVWHRSEHDNYRHLPDVGDNIEVRRIRTRNTAAVRRHQVGQGLVLFVARPHSPEFTTVDVFGWMHYDHAWELGNPSDYDPANTRTIDIEHLNAYIGRVAA